MIYSLNTYKITLTNYFVMIYHKISKNNSNLHEKSKKKCLSIRVEIKQNTFVCKNYISKKKNKKYLLLDSKIYYYI